ncbi:hypothetical protein Fmac_006461 [Flemingia macrophylla]|uniref:Uncharacterized protein n=1 Tax=Flemingia macrophylla TaxID=520843 RepID=A0ABD1NAP8_9FABA
MSIGLSSGRINDFPRNNFQHIQGDTTCVQETMSMMHPHEQHGQHDNLQHPHKQHVLNNMDNRLSKRTKKVLAPTNDLVKARIPMIENEFLEYIESLESAITRGPMGQVGNVGESDPTPSPAKTFSRSPSSGDMEMDFSRKKLPIQWSETLS